MNFLSPLDLFRDPEEVLPACLPPSETLSSFQKDTNRVDGPFMAGTIKVMWFAKAGFWAGNGERISVFMDSLLPEIMNFALHQ